MLYELENAPFAQKTATNSNSSCTNNKNNNNNANKIKMIQSPHRQQQDKDVSSSQTVQINGNTSSKPYGPELPPKLDKQLSGNLISTYKNNSHDGQNKSNSNDSNDSKYNSNVVNNEKATKFGNAAAAAAAAAATTTNSIKLNGSSKSDNCLNSNNLNKLTNGKANNNTKANMNYNKENVTKLNNKNNSINSGSSMCNKLVPYDDETSSSDESSSSPEENNSRVSTKAAVGEWKVTSTSGTATVDDKITVNELLKMSHNGYSAPVSSWNGTRAALDKEIANEKREDRKRSLSDNSDQGRVKHLKTNSNENFKSNPGYNPIQVSN